MIVRAMCFESQRGITMDRRNLSRNLLAVAVGVSGCSGSGSSTLAALQTSGQSESTTAPYFAITAAETYAKVPASSIDTSIPPYRADRYGFSNAPGASGTDNAIALRHAVAAATAAGARLKIPGSVSTTAGVPVSLPVSSMDRGVPYPYVASAVLELTCDVEGDGAMNTVISCSGGSGGPGNYFAYFRLVDHSEIRDLEISNAGSISDGTIGLHLSNSSQLETQAGPLYAKGNMRVTRVRIKKFATNIQAERSYLVTFDQVESLLGGYGFYCQPDVTAPGDSASAFVTTHLHLNCFYSQNAINIFYQTPIASYCVTFVNGASQNATAAYQENGASFSNYFADLSNVHFIDWYTENQPAAIVITGGGTATFDGLWLGVTGGIYLGAGVWARFVNVRSASSAGSKTDNLVVAAGGRQYVTMDGCIWPNTTPLSQIDHCVVMKTEINGVYTAFSAT